MKKRCVIIGASPETDPGLLEKSILPGDYIICADGGYVFAEKAGIVPDAVIGDFDSSPCPQDISCEVISLPVKKDDTDSLYAAREALLHGYDDFLLLGMTGGRTDQTMASYSTLLFLKERRASAVLLDKNGEVMILSGESYRISGRKGCGFAVFPFGCGQCCVSLEGFEYGLERGILTAGFPLGVSNRIISEEALVKVYEGSAIIFISACPPSLRLDPCTR